MKATHDKDATPQERRAIFDRLNESYRTRENELRSFWLNIGISDGMRGLDAACGSGEWMRALSRQFNNAKLFGIDLAEDFLGWAEQISKDEGLQNINYYISDIAESSKFGLFDFVHIGDLLAGIKNPDSIIQCLTDSLNPGGRLIIEDIDIDLWTINPPDPDWDAVIEAIQTRGKRHAARELASKLDNLGFEKITIKAIGSGARLDSPKMFGTLHTFFESEDDRNWVLSVVKKLKETAAELNRFGFVNRLVISGVKPR